MRKTSIILVTLLLLNSFSGFLPQAAASNTIQENNSQTTQVFHELEKSQNLDQVQTKKKTNELTSIISEQIQRNRQKNSEPQFSSQRVVTPRSKLPISINAVNENYTTNIGTTLSITGTLKSGQVPWTDEQVILIRPGYANQTTLTDSNGDYQFDLIYSKSEIGRHNYTVYFPGNIPLLRQAATLKDGVITVRDTITMEATTDQVSTTVAPNTAYNVIITFKHSDGSFFNPSTATFTDEFNNMYDLSGLTVNVSETYQDTGGGTPETSTALNIVDLSVNSDTLTIPSNTGNQIASMDILLSVYLRNYTPLGSILSFNSETDTQNPFVVNKLILQIEVEYVFTASFFIDGANLNQPRYYRNNQNITVSGQLSNAVLDPSFVRGVGYTWTLAYGGSTLATRNGKTDANGMLKETFFLNKTTFNDPTAGLQITVQIDTSNATITNLNPSSVSKSFGLFEYASTIVADALPDTSAVYAKQGDQFTLTGIVSDVDTNPAEGATVEFSIYDSNNIAVAGFSPSTQTNSTGQFALTISIPDLLTGNGIFSIRATVVNGTFPTDIWYTTAPVFSDHGNFNFTRGAQLSVQNLRGVPLVNGNISNVFNVSFSQLLLSNPNYTINVIDFFGRAPFGMTVRVVEEGLNWAVGSLIYTINSSNNGFFEVKIGSFSQILNSTGPNAARLLNRAGDTFEYIISLNYSTGALEQTRNEFYRIYGPDETPPTLNLNSLQIIGANSPSDINISISLSDISQVHNIRNVTIWFRLSVNSNVNDTTPDFTGQGYVPRLMTNDTTNNRFTFTFKFNSSQNGVWIDFYIVAFDLAGNGLDVNGITIRPPAYDPSYTLSYDIRSNPSWANQGIIRMGDTTVQAINLGVDVTVNGTQLGAFSSSIDNGSSLIVVFNAPVDETNISKVYITYRTRVINPETLVGGPWSNNITVEMTQINSQQWSYTFTPDMVVWGIEIDYKFSYRDFYGNAAETQFVTEFFSGVQTRRNPVVVDSIAPIAGVVLQSPYNSTYPITGRPGNNGTAYEIWTNETVTLLITVTDFDGSGLKNVTVIISYFDANGTQLDTVVAVLYNSTVFGEGQNLTLEYVVPRDLYTINGSLIWVVNAMDKFGNSVTINQNGIDFIIKEPPKPPLPPNQTIISTDIVTTINGSVVTIQTSIVLTNGTGLESGNDFRGLIILGFFILGLVTLVIYYKRHTFLEYLRRRNRARLLTSRLQDITDDIVRLAKDGNYKEAVLLIWEAFERACREALQSPRKYNMTVRMYVDYIGTISLVDPLVLTTLAHIFEKARYGNEEVTEDDFKEAFNALEVTIQTLIATGAARRVILDEDDDDFDIDIEAE